MSQTAKSFLIFFFIGKPVGTWVHLAFRPKQTFQRDDVKNGVGFPISDNCGTDVVTVLL